VWAAVFPVLLCWLALRVFGRVGGVTSQGAGGPKVTCLAVGGQSCTLRLVWHPVDWAQPDHAVPRGNIRPLLSAELARLAPGAPRGSPWGSRRDATPCTHPAEPAVLLEGRLSRRLPARRGPRCAKDDVFTVKVLFLPDQAG
jgi:hypothetical protein